MVHNNFVDLQQGKKFETFFSSCLIYCLIRYLIYFCRHQLHLCRKIYWKRDFYVDLEFPKLRWMLFFMFLRFWYLVINMAAIFNSWLQRQIVVACVYLSYPFSHWLGVTQSQFFEWSRNGLNSQFSFKISCCNKAKELGFLYYLPVSRVEEM